MYTYQLYAEIERGINNLDNTLFLPSSEITMALNKVIHEYVKEAYMFFERNEENRKRLSKLIKTTAFESGSDITENTDLAPSIKAFDVRLPENAKFILLEIATLVPENSGQNGVQYTSRVTPINLDTIMTNLNNPFRKAYLKKVWRIEHKGINNEVNKIHTLVVPEGFELYRYTVSYIEVPPAITDITQPVNLDNYFDPIYQYELVELVIQEAIRPYVGKAAQNQPQEPTTEEANSKVQ